MAGRRGRGGARHRRRRQPDPDAERAAGLDRAAGGIAVTDNPVDAPRIALLDRFLHGQGWAAAARAPIAGDASFRRYWRLTDGAGGRVIVMDAPPDREDTRPFAALAGHLTDQGLSAPRVLATDHDNGFLLLEDLGDDTFTRVLAAAPGREAALYEAAVDTLVALGRAPAPEALPVPGDGGHRLGAYDRAALLSEAALMTDWYLPELGHGPDPASARADLAGLLAPLMPAMVAARPVLVLRDYHVDNLMWLPDRAAPAGVGLLDFQDALLGHPAYDLVSLLQDVRRPIPADLEERLLARYIAASGEDPAAFRLAYRLLGVQRNLKIAGIFTRLWRRDAKPVYLPLIPRAWALVARNLAGPETAALEAWLDRVVPPDRRSRPFVPDSAHGVRP
nr:phosphotransferase [Rhodothalassium salexigens]